MSLPSLRSRNSIPDVPQPSPAGRNSARSAEIEPSPAQDPRLKTPGNSKVVEAKEAYVSQEDGTDTREYGCEFSQ